MQTNWVEIPDSKSKKSGMSVSSHSEHSGTEEFDEDDAKLLALELGQLEQVMGKTPTLK